MDKEYIKEKVVQVYKECGVRSFPVDCFAILNHYNLRTITYQEAKKNSPDLYTAISGYSKDAFKFRMTIYYNASNANGRIRFTLMHELGHYVLGHTESTPDNEDAADYFASQMLAPRVAINKHGCTTSEELHKLFGLSYAAANRTLIDYKSWNNGRWSTADKTLAKWLYSPEPTQKHPAKTVRRRNQSTRRYIRERASFLAENYDMFAIAEHNYLYGKDL